MISKYLSYLKSTIKKFIKIIGVIKCIFNVINSELFVFMQIEQTTSGQYFVTGELKNRNKLFLDPL